ncbi:hypothetical protein I546_3113 [Mycobacterium kansasii 732]|nr:hypothetical protein I546_3113 [Mycobacterium kansasii 732]
MVLWLFVLVPMLISKRDAVRRTSDVALATRVLNGGASARLLKRTGPAAGHRSDPHWKPEEDWGTEPVGQADDDVDQDTAPVHDVASDADVADEVDRPGAVVMKVGAAGQARETEADRPDYLDVEVVEENAGALPAGASARNSRADAVGSRWPIRCGRTGHRGRRRRRVRTRHRGAVRRADRRPGACRSCRPC